MVRETGYNKKENKERDIIIMINWETLKTNNHKLSSSKYSMIERKKIIEKRYLENKR